MLDEDPTLRIFLNLGPKRAWSSSICDYYDKRSYPKTLSWNMSKDYCLWYGVTRNKTSGQVIEVDISCISGDDDWFQIALSSSFLVSKCSTFLGITTPNLTSRQIDDFNCILLRNVVGRECYCTQIALATEVTFSHMPPHLITFHSIS